MAEYIDREKAFKLFKEQKVKETGAFSKGLNKGLNIARSIVHNKEVLPTADVVEVVRCEECKYKEDCARQMVHTTRDYVLEQNISSYNKVDFCSYGEKRSEGK